MRVKTLSTPLVNGGGSRRSRRRLLTVLGGGICLLILLTLQLGDRPDVIDIARYYATLSINSSIVDEENGQCRVPILDPWDPSIRPYIKNAPPLECRQIQPRLSFLDSVGRLCVNATAVEAAGYAIDRLVCTYRCFGRRKNDDQNLEFDEPQSLENCTHLECEFVQVDCRRRMPPLSVYSQLHAQVVPKTQVLINKSHKIGDIKQRYGVTLFVLDSVSQNHWRRALTRTLQTLEGPDYEAVVMQAFNKVGDNSFPNAAAFLLGWSPPPSDGGMTANFNEWPLIWRDFARAGYATLYAEDSPSFNLFNYMAAGFREQPVDHYFRPYWLAVYNSLVYRRSSHLCYNDQPMHKVQMQYLVSLLERYENQRVPIFALQWLTELAHDWLNQISSADDDIADILEKQKYRFDDQFLFMFSDHGHRFDAVRETFVGRLEERLPFFSVHVPRSLRTQYPHFDKVLRWNAKQLTSFYDLHITLHDILDLQTRDAWHELADDRNNQKAIRRFRALAPHGHSLLRHVPANRTCADAGVPDEYCACVRERAVNVETPIVQRAARDLVAHVNTMLGVNSKQPTMSTESQQCARLSLHSVRSARVELPRDTRLLHGRVERSRSATGALLGVRSGGGERAVESRARGVFVNYGLVVRVAPSNALLDGHARHYLTDDRVEIVGDVSRINRYGNQSACVHDAVLRKFCFCTGS